MGQPGMVGSAEVVERLREKIRALEANPKDRSGMVATGIPPIDEFLGGGFPLGTAVELVGEAASGRTSLALRALAQATQEGRLCAYVDCPRELYAPFVASLGVSLPSLLVVRPEKTSQGVWAALQLVRSATFACVALDLTRTGHRLSLAEGKKLCDAAARSGTLLFILTSPEAPSEGTLRIGVSALGIRGFSLEVLSTARAVTARWSCRGKRSIPTRRCGGTDSQSRCPRCP